MHEPSFSEKAREIISQIPRGRVATYGQVAAYAGNPRAARQVVRVLHASSRKYGLPWHRVINRLGGISLEPGHGGETQMEMLKAEGVEFSDSGKVDLQRWQWQT